MSQDKGEAVSLSTPALVTQFDRLARAPGGVARLRALILALAVRGKLVPQDSREDPARLEVVVEQVLQLIADGKVPKSRASEPLEDRSDEWELPVGWAAVRGSDVFIPRSGNSKLIKGKLFSEPGEGLYAGYSASGQDVWLSSFEYDGTAVILSAVGARCGKAFLARGKWSAIANTHIVWPIEGVVSGEYAMLLLNDENFWIRSGGAQPFLKVTETLQKTVLISPIREQARIVVRVDELMHLCDALEAKGQLEAQQHARLLETLLGTLTGSTTPEELAAHWQRVAEHFDLLLDRPEAVDVLEQTVLQLAVRGLLVERDQYGPPDCPSEGAVRSAVPYGWTRRQFGDVVTMLNGYAFKSDWFRASGIRLVRNVNVSHGQLDWSHSAFVSTDLAEEFSQFSLTAGDVVLSLDRPIISTGLKLAVIRSIDLPCLLLQRVARLTPDPKALSARYMELWLSSDRFLNTIDPGRSNGVPHISTKQVAALEIDLPPVDEQARIVARVTELRRFCGDLRQRLVASQATQSRLAEALVAAATA